MKNGLEKTSKQSKTRAASLAIKARKSAATVDSALQHRIDDSAVMQRQRQQIDNAFGTPLQRIAEDEELLQGKFASQLQADLDEEELMQGKFDGPLQRFSEEEEELLQGKFSAPLQKQAMEDEELLQGKFNPPLQREQDKPAPNQTGMPDHLKRGVESLSGLDMSNLRVHYNSLGPAQLDAHAYAQGNNIHLGPGQEQHLPHEAWHVVQQQQGRVQATTEVGGEQVNDDPGLEREADVMGEKAARVKR